MLELERKSQSQRWRRRRQEKSATSRRRLLMMASSQGKQAASLSKNKFGFGYLEVERAKSRVRDWGVNEKASCFVELCTSRIDHGQYILRWLLEKKLQRKSAISESALYRTRNTENSLKKASASFLKGRPFEMPKVHFSASFSTSNVYFIPNWPQNVQGKRNKMR